MGAQPNLAHQPDVAHTPAWFLARRLSLLSAISPWNTQPRLPVTERVGVVAWRAEQYLPDLFAVWVLVGYWFPSAAS
jgi:hypothetical protein